MYINDPYEESGMTHEDFGEVPPPPPQCQCPLCGLACNSWDDFYVCAHFPDLGLVGQYFGSRGVPCGTAFEQEVPF